MQINAWYLPNQPDNKENNIKALVLQMFVSCNEQHKEFIQTSYFFQTAMLWFSYMTMLVNSTASAHYYKAYIMTKIPSLCYH